MWGKQTECMVNVHEADYQSYEIHGLLAKSSDPPMGSICPYSKNELNHEKYSLYLYIDMRKINA